MTLATSPDNAGGFLVSPIFRAQVERLLYARPVFLSLATTFPVNRREVHLHHVLTGPAPEFICEGDQKPSSDLTFGRDTMNVQEVAGIVTWSDRLNDESFADPGIRSLVERELVAAASDKIDRYLIANTPDTNEPCAITGLLNQNGFQGVAYGTEADLGEDIRRALRLARVENFEPTAILLHSTALDLLLSIRTNQDELKYPSVANPNPSIWGKSLVVSNNIPTHNVTDGVVSDVVVADWSKILVATMPISILASNVATVGGESNFEHDRTSLRYVANVSSPMVRTPHLGSVVVISDVISP